MLIYILARSMNDHGSNPPIRPNAFQRLMRQWDQIHPYNAAQALEIHGVIDVARASWAWKTVIVAMRLRRMMTIGDALAEACVQDTVNDAGVDVLPSDLPPDVQISPRLNRVFSAEESPFKPFLIQHRSSFHIGIVYRHWIADGFSIRGLLRNWASTVSDTFNASAAPDTLDPSVASPHPRELLYRDVFAGGGIDFDVSDAMLRTLRWWYRFRWSRPLDLPDEAPMETATRSIAVPAGFAAALRAAARRRGASVNDVLMSAAAEAAFAVLRLRCTRRRRDVSVGAIVDLRPFAAGWARDAFGMLLGFCSVRHPAAEIADWPRLLRSTSAQMRSRLAPGVLPFDSAVAIAGAELYGRFWDGPTMGRWYASRTPLIAGVSNVRLDAADFGPTLAPKIKSYQRFSPTGPMMPIVLNATTLGPDMQLSITHRLAAVDPGAAERFVEIATSRLFSL